MKKETENEVQMKKHTRESNEETKIPEDDDRQYYKDEVGEDPDAGKKFHCCKLVLCSSRAN